MYPILSLLCALCIVFSCSPSHAADYAPNWCRGPDEVNAWTDRGLPLHQDDLRFLQEVKSGATQSFGLFSGWTNDTHPCDWCGVFCQCELQVYPAFAKSECPDGGMYPDVERLFGLDLGSGARPSGQGFVGTLPTEIGLITEAKVLYFHGDKMTGTLPSELGLLTGLIRLLMRDNDLTGTLPAMMSGSRVKDLYLDNNQLVGSIPEEWCAIKDAEDARLTVLHMAGNRDLCGAIPACGLSNMVPKNPVHISGTCLQHPSNPVGGMCDKTPPTCNKLEGCLTTPAIVNRLDFFEFSIDGYEDLQSGIRSIRFRLGTNASTLEESQNAMAEKTVPLNSTVKFESRSVHLTNGLTYYVTLIAANGACPELTTTSISKPILVDNTPPQPVMIDGAAALYTNAQCELGRGVQTNTDSLDACWFEFMEPESNVSHYEYQILVVDNAKEGGSAVVTPFTSEGVSCVGGRCGVRRVLLLRTGCWYSVVVKAYNLAGDWSLVQSSLLLVDDGAAADNHTLVVVLVVVCAMLVLVAGGLMLWFYMDWRKRQVQAEIERRERLELEELEEELVETLETLFGQASWNRRASPQKFLGPETIFSMEEVVFVFTDIEDSTAMAAANPSLYREVQETHDHIMRQSLVTFEGVEVNTQGDSFELAFGTVVSAVRFCMQVQLRLLNARWPDGCYSMPGCGKVLSPNGKLLFAGPRVRMGIHLAHKDQFTSHLHRLTKHVQFFGPGVQLASKIGDSCHGGQIVISEPAFQVMEGSLSSMGVVVKHLGMWQFSGSADAICIYEVMPPAMGRMPSRFFPEVLRGCDNVAPPFGLQLAKPPIPTLEKPDLTVVIINTQNLSAEQMMDVSNVLGSFSQLFGGYEIQTSQVDQFAYMYDDPAPAIRFGMLVQMGMMAAPWSNVNLDVERASNGSVVFRGPRLAVLVHCSPDIQCHVNNNVTRGVGRLSTEAVSIVIGQAPSPRAATGELDVGAANNLISAASPPARESTSMEGRPSSNRPSLIGHAPLPDGTSKRDQELASWRQRRGWVISQSVVYSGTALDDAITISRIVHYGQLVVTENVWTRVQANLPNLTQVISLGEHQLPGKNTTPQVLMELSTHSVSQRDFPDIVSVRCLSPGYRQSPSVNQWMVIMFAKVPICPDSLPEGMSMHEFETLYNASVDTWCDLVRHLLQKFRGYECKEPEKGKFTLAFQDFKDAIAFACSAQSELMDLDYDPRLLQHPACAVVLDPSSGLPVYRGLRATIGLAYGKATFRKPITSTGRADYFGPLPNKAARLMGAAASGQVVMEATFLHEVLGSPLPPYNPMTLNHALGLQASRSFRSGASFKNKKLLTALSKRWKTKSNLDLEPSAEQLWADLQEKDHSVTSFYMGHLVSDESSFTSFGQTQSSDNSFGAMGTQLQSNATKTGGNPVLLRQLEEHCNWSVEGVRIPDCDVPEMIFTGLGCFYLKGIAIPVPLAQACLSRLRGRSHPPPRNKRVTDMIQAPADASTVTSVG